MADVDPRAATAASHGEQHDGDATSFEALSEALRVAFASVTASSLPPDVKGRWHRRLIAITTTAKRDTRRAVAALERFEREWKADGEP